MKTIVLTHLHIDHDGGLKDFPHARVFVAAGELAAARGFVGRVRGYLPQRWPSGFDPQPIHFADQPFGPFARSRPLTQDGAVVALPTPGHTPHHLSVALVDEDFDAAFRWRCFLFPCESRGPAHRRSERRRAGSRRDP